MGLLVRVGMVLMSFLAGAKVEDIATVSEGEGSGWKAVRTAFGFVTALILVLVGVLLFWRRKKKRR